MTSRQAGINRDGQLSAVVSHVNVEVDVALSIVM